MSYRNHDVPVSRVQAVLLILVLTLTLGASNLVAQEAATNEVAAAATLPAETVAAETLEETNLVVATTAPEEPATGETQPEAPAAREESAKPPQANRPITDRVRMGGDLHVAPGEKVNDAVSMFGESKVEGEVRGDMVTLFGRSLLAGGEVRGDMVTVFGETTVDGVVHGDMVVVFGDMSFGPGAAIDGDCVAVFGSMDGDPGILVSGDVVQVMPWFSGLGTYLREGPLKGRLIPLTSVLAWIVVAVHLVIYLLVALLLPRPIASSIEQIRSKPLQSFGVGLLVMLLIGPLTAILAMTGVGVLLLPFIGLAETAFLILGKTAFLQFFGLQVLRKKSEADSGPSLLPFLVGFALLTLLYMVPVVALVVWAILRPLSLGAPILAMFANGRSKGNGDAPPAVPVDTSLTPSPALKAAVASPVVGDTAEEASSSDAPEVQMMRRAGFWIRLAAAALDLLLLSWLVPFADKYFLLIWIAYHVGLWAWRGTTIGGIICKLKVVRVDGSPIDFGVALVRGLSSVFSAAALFLGFFWVGWTRERQSWHDLIAGTVIVRVPREVSLV